VLYLLNIHSISLLVLLYSEQEFTLC
jgi:hypothetical protein